MKSPVFGAERGIAFVTADAVKRVALHSGQSPKGWLLQPGWGRCQEDGVLGPNRYRR